MTDTMTTMELLRRRYNFLWISAYVSGYNFQEHLTATVGIKNGLKLILDLHSNQESFGTVQTDWSGFQVRVCD